MHDDDHGDEYDPHEHRNSEKPTTDLQTLILMIKGIFGIGILSVPEAFSYSGWLQGIIGNFFLGGLSTHCIHMLIRSQYVLCKRHRVPILTYPETMLLALEKGPRCLRWLSKPSLWMPDTFMIAYEIAVCAVYIIFTAQNIKHVTDYYWIKLEIRIIIAALIAPLAIVFLIRNLKYLTIISQVANIMIFTSLAIMFYYICQDLPPLAKRKKIGHPRYIPLYFGTALFAITSIGTTITLENNMKNPKNFTGCFGILNIGSAISMILFSLTGFLGSWKYGDEAFTTVTLNLPGNEILAQTVQILFAVAIFISYALQGYVPVEIWLNRLKRNNPNVKNPIRCEYLIRIFVLTVSFAFAALLARLEFIIAFIGALCESMLIIIFPALVEICVLYPDKYGRYNYLFVKCMVLITIGIIACITGSYCSIACYINSVLAGHYIIHGSSVPSYCRVQPNECTKYYF